MVTGQQRGPRASEQRLREIGVPSSGAQPPDSALGELDRLVDERDREQQLQPVELQGGAGYVEAGVLAVGGGQDAQRTRDVARLGGGDALVPAHVDDGELHPQLGEQLRGTREVGVGGGGVTEGGPAEPPVVARPRLADLVAVLDGERDGRAVRGVGLVEATGEVEDDAALHVPVPDLDPAQMRKGRGERSQPAPVRPPPAST